MKIEPVATVAEVHMSRYTLEWKNGPLPEGEKLYTEAQLRQLAEACAEAIEKCVSKHQATMKIRELIKELLL